MIIKNCGEISSNFYFNIILVEEWEKDQINDAIKILNPVTPIIVNEKVMKEKNIIYRHNSQDIIHLIASSDTMCFTGRVYLSNKVAKRFETFLHHISIELITERVGTILNDAYMLATEKIIKSSK